MGTPKVLVEGSSVSASQLQDFFRQVADGSINRWNLQFFLNHKGPVGLDTVVIDWPQVYKALGMSEEWKNDSAKIVTDPHPNFWDVYVVKGVTPNKVVKVFRDLGVMVDLYTQDLGKDLPINDRDPSKDGSYRVRFVKRVEADPELKEKSAEKLAEEGIKAITLLERLLLGLGYFLATGNHLDGESLTLCSGSRRSDGGVPSVNWRVGRHELCVDWYSPSRSGSDLRARAVV